MSFCDIKKFLTLHLLSFYSLMVDAMTVDPAEQ
jgi:hypothetical protein